MMRVMPVRVKMAVSVATSSGKPLCARPPWPAVFAFAVFANDDPIEISGVYVAKWASDAGQNAGGTDIRILIEALADGEAQTPKRDVVRDFGIAHGSEVDGIEAFQLFQAVGGHHAAVGAIVVRAPRE